MIGIAGWTNGAYRVDVVNRGGRDYWRVLGAIGGVGGRLGRDVELHTGKPWDRRMQQQQQHRTLVEFDRLS